MSEKNSGIQVGQQGDVTLLRLEGKGTHVNSHLLKQYILQCLEENHRFFQIDLSQCNYMDSTFLGMLAGLGIKTEKCSLPRIKLLNSTDRVRGMVEGLGIDHLFEFVCEKQPATPLNTLQGNGLNKDAKSREMLESHEKLVQISPANETKFRDVITLLRQKVSKTETETS